MRHAPFRLLRTSLIGATILGLAAGAHVLGGGTLPAWPIMTAILALHMLCSTISTKFRLSFPVMLGLLATSQATLHQAFDVLSQGASIPAGTFTTESLAVMSHHSMGAEAQSADMLATAIHMTSQHGAAAGMAGHSGALSGWMLLAHAVATLAAAALLCFGENALWTLARWLRPLWRGAAVVLAVPAQRTRPGITPCPLPQLPWRNIPPNTRRGPPALAAIFK